MKQDHDLSAFSDSTDKKLHRPCKKAKAARELLGRRHETNPDLRKGLRANARALGFTEKEIVELERLYAGLVD